MMDYIVGQHYLLRNDVTFEGQYFLCREVLPYQGHRIVLGENLGRKTRTNRGTKDWEGRPTCIPVPSYEIGRGEELGEVALAAVIGETGGDQGTGRYLGQTKISLLPEGADPLSRAVKVPAPGAAEDPVLMANRSLATFWGGSPFKSGHWERPPGHELNREGMIRCARKLLNLYDDLLHTGVVPAWFRYERIAALREDQKQGTYPPDWSQPLKGYFGGIDPLP